VESDPVFSRADRAGMNHEQKYVRGCQKAVAYVQRLRRATDADEARWVYQAVDEILPVDVHSSMFIPCLEHQTSDEQRRRWLGPAQRYEIIGAYAQ
ncbi:unnamed protein product, partial [Heterosigma akashiwo]